MKALKVSKDVVTLAEFKSQAPGLQDADKGKTLTSSQAKSRLGIKK